MSALFCRLVASVSLGAASATAFAGVTLAGDDPPTDPLWKKPATLSYTREGDGTSNTTADAVLRYKDTLGARSGAGVAHQTTYSGGVYLHRDNSESAPRNDRGFSASLGEEFVPDWSNAGGVFKFNLQGKFSYGKSLQSSKDASGATTQADKTKDREILKLGGYFQPAEKGVPPVPGSGARPALVMYFDATIGLYSDNSRGGGGTHNGRLSGTLASVSANFAPFGLDPASGSAFNKIGTLGFVPTVELSAQTQHDSSSSGDRTKSSYRLYTASLTFSFEKLNENSGTIVPSLSIARSIGADLLGGRPYTGKTEITFGLSF
jgi:hypothetical protein